MKKLTPAKVSKKNRSKNGTGLRPLPDSLSPAVAEALLEDAVMEAAADIAALSATLEERTDSLSEPELVVGAIVPETPEEQALLELVSVPYLGPARVQALAEMGILTLDDLRAAPPEKIAGLRGVGANNAQRIKEWLAQQPRAQTPPPSLSTPAPASSSDPAVGDINQAIYDELAAVDNAIERLTARLGPPSKSKRLRRQLDKVSTVASELAEGPDTLTADELLGAVELLGDIAYLLDCAASEKKLSEKKQEGVGAAVRSLRKSLEKTLGE
ncbi:MAG: helix-hairpin-helix domain-containing protein [Armatimonadota bacterium]|nr:helix-hairpin-helix domain-containing protein [Armatimonadota bacterium]